jgi:hypothetical protein
VSCSLRCATWSDARANSKSYWREGFAVVSQLLLIIDYRESREKALFPEGGAFMTYSEYSGA